MTRTSTFGRAIGNDNKALVGDLTDTKFNFAWIWGDSNDVIVGTGNGFKLNRAIVAGDDNTVTVSGTFNSARVSGDGNTAVVGTADALGNSVQGRGNNNSVNAGNTTGSNLNSIRVRGDDNLSVYAGFLMGSTGNSIDIEGDANQGVFAAGQLNSVPIRGNDNQGTILAGGAVDAEANSVFVNGDSNTRGGRRIRRRHQRELRVGVR